MKTCVCNYGLSNTGLPGCPSLNTVLRAGFYTPTYDSVGGRNRIALTDDIDEAYILAKLNHADKSKRWYPIVGMQNYTNDKADPVYETTASGDKFFIKDGIRTVAFEALKVEPVYKTQLDKMACEEVSVFGIDSQGSIIGMVPETEDGYLYPIRIAQGSFYTKFIFPTDSTQQKLMVTFDFDQREEDGQLRTIISTDMEANLLNARGLLDIMSLLVGSATTTVFTLDLYTLFGSEQSKKPLTGLVVGDFYSVAGGVASRVYNVTDALAVTLTSVVESSTVPGRYTFTMSAAQGSGEVIRITPVKNGYDFSEVILNTVLMP